MPTPCRSVDILLVDDNPADIELTRAALGDCGSRTAKTLHVACDGVEAMRFLRAAPPYDDAPRPDLVLLDLNMPRMNGREVLREMLADPSLRTIPVVVLSTSSAPEDVRTAYALQANSFVTKPVDFGRFREVVQSLDHFWFGTAALPECPAQGRRTDPSTIG